MIPWKYKGKEIIEVPEGAIGFVYLITFTDGDKYIGKKNLFSTRRIKVKDRKNRKVVVKESNWKVYCSSSDTVKERIKNGESFSREILMFGDSKGAITFLEIKEMIIRCVLCDDMYLNKNIFSRIFRCYLPMDI